MKILRKLTFRTAIPAALTVLVANYVAPPASAALPYADTEWPSVHGGPRNDDTTEVLSPLGYRQHWDMLRDSSTLAPPTVSENRTFFQTTGKGIGSSNLHAFDINGNILWQSPPMTSAADLDGCAMLNSPIVDPDGDTYTSDCNQLWAYHEDGSLKWVIDLPAPPAGASFQSPDLPVNSFITAFFTLEGDVGGITTFGDVVIVNREDGTPAAEAFKIPVQTVPVVIPHPPGLLAGLVDPTLTSYIWNVAIGAPALATIDTPAVHPETGRIFTSAKASTPGVNALWGLDVVYPEGGGLATIEVAFEISLGEGGGSSPGISPDHERVYAGNGDGEIVGVNTATGAIEILIDAQNEAASPSIDADGNLYLLAEQGKSFSPDGSLRWSGDFTAVADAQGLPAVLFHPFFGLMNRAVVQNGVTTITDEAVTYPIGIGYRVENPQNPGTFFNVPVRILTLNLDPATGELLEGYEPIDLVTGTEAWCLPVLEGSTICNGGGFAASLVAAVKPALDPLLAHYGAEVTPAVGGLQTVQARDDLFFSVDGLDIRAPISSGDILGNPVQVHKDVAIEVDASIPGFNISGTVTWGNEESDLDGELFIEDLSDGSVYRVIVQKAEISDSHGATVINVTSGKLYVNDKKSNQTFSLKLRDWS